MEEPRATPRKPSRQLLRAQARQKRDAEGWIAALRVTDPQTRRAIRTALGTRHVTRADLETALGMSLEEQPPGNE